MPSHPHVATFDGSIGCHYTSMQTPSCTFIVLKFLQVFQFQNHNFPSASPLVKNYPSGENVNPHAYPLLICPVNFFFLFNLKLPLLSYITILLSIDYPAKYLPLGCMAAAGIAYISGSLMCLATTGIPNSQTWILLSSAVETKRLPLSMKVIVLIDP